MTTDIGRIMEQEQAAERARAVDRIKNIHDIAKQLKPLAEADKQEREALKQYLELNRGTLDTDEKGQPLLYNGEVHETWVLRGSTTNGYDLVSAAEAEPDVVVQAAKAGWLKADHGSIEKHPGASWVDRLKRYYMPTSGSESLVKKD